MFGATAKLDVSDMSRVMRRKMAFIRSDAAARAMATSAEYLVVPAARLNLRANKSIFEGWLFKSLTSRVVSHAGVVSVVEVVTLGVQYGKNVEEGVPAGRPFRVTQKLVRWARLKVKASNPEAMAAAVVRKLRARGQAAKPFLRPAYRAKKMALYVDFGKRWVRGLARA